MSLRAGLDLLLAESATHSSTGQPGHVHTMASLCDELFRLTSTSLDYAGLVQGTLPLNLGSVTIGALIQETDRHFESIAASRWIEWECRLEGPDATVTTDASHCQKIIGNIVENALRVTPEGGAVRLTGHMDGTSWIIRVEDEGPGIPPDELGRVFEPYYRLIRSEQSRAEGIGLGLATCREMVDQLGGEIQIHSSFGKGTRVDVKLLCDPPNSPCVRSRTSNF